MAIRLAGWYFQNIILEDKRALWVITPRRPMRFQSPNLLP